MSVKKLQATCTATFLASRGVLLTVAAGLLISGATLLVKYMPNIHPAQHAVCRCWFLASLALPHIIARQDDIFGPHPYRISVFITSLISGTGLISHFLTFKYLPLGEGAVLMSSYPVLAIIAGRILLKEKFGLSQVAAALATIVGMIFTTHLHTTIVHTSKTYSTENLYGLAAALVTILCAAAGAILVRKLRNIHFAVFVFNGGVIGVIEALILTECMTSFSFPSGHFQQGLIILLGFLSYCGLICAIISLKYGEAGPMSTVRASSEIFFSFVWQVSIFGNIPDGETILGATLVGCSIIIIGFNQKFKSHIHERWQWLC